MAWASWGPHAFLYFRTIRRLPSPLSFVRSCFHLSSLLLSRSTCYSHTIPSIPRSCNNVLFISTTSSSTHHTSFPYSLAGPKLNIWRHLVFDFGPTTSQTQIPWSLAAGSHFWGAPFCTPYFFVWGPWSLPTLTNLQVGTSAYTRRRGTRGRSVGLP